MTSQTRTKVDEVRNLAKQVEFGDLFDVHRGLLELKKATNEALSSVSQEIQESLDHAGYARPAPV
jgi:hypothetical protein